MHPLLTKQDQLHTDAAQLLESTLLPILSKYGKVEVNGSYLYKLLYHPDIDLYVINEDISKQMYVDLCTELLNLDTVSKLKTGDRVSFPHKKSGDRPTGYWVSPTIHTDNFEWSCDIWLQKPAWVNPKIYRYDETLTKLSNKNRLLVLTIKEELITKGRYGVGKDFESVDIYDAILKNPNINLEELRRIF